MWTNKSKLWRFTLCVLFTAGALAATVKGDDEVPSETQCRPFVEKALKELGTGDAHSGSSENGDSHEVSVDDGTKDTQSIEDDNSAEDRASIEVTDEPYVGGEAAESLETEVDSGENSKEDEQNSQEDESGEEKDGDDSKEATADDGDSKEEVDGDSKEDVSAEDITAEQMSAEDDDADNDSGEGVKAEEDDSTENKESLEANADDGDSKEDNQLDSKEADDTEDHDESNEVDSKEVGDDSKDSADIKENDTESQEVAADGDDSGDKDSETDSEDSKEAEVDGKDHDNKDGDSEEKTDSESKSEEQGGSDGDESDGVPEEDLMMDTEVPENLRSRDHITQILRLDAESSESEILIERSADIILRDLKRTYENSIKPLETLYKYRDLSNRHFGDPEIFSKPLVLFMGPWSGGKSSILNYLTGLEFTEWSLRSGAEPSPAYFNILMHGAKPEVLDGTQLAADWTFSGLQKFGQGLEERLRGLKYPSKLLEKVNIVEIPGILEVRKQVSRVFPFNDACQWFIDRADIIFLVYDPAKLDVGPETEAILDQLKGRESQTRIVLNKADRVKPEELMRVQSALIWNISPLMSSAQPPAMYTVSLWSLPWEEGAPTRLLRAQEHELLRDLRTAIDRRIENKISSARRFAVRVRNHAKMVDCYLTTYYNHKTIFGNKKLIADAIIENPQNYHIYEGLSTLTNISRYDLPDPETYRDFFRLNPLYDFQQLSATCTYFRGCPINKLDVAIAYDLPELVGKYKKMVETATPQGMPKS